MAGGYGGCKGNKVKFGPLTLIHSKVKVDGATMKERVSNGWYQRRHGNCARVLFFRCCSDLDDVAF